MSGERHGNRPVFHWSRDFTVQHSGADPRQCPFCYPPTTDETEAGQ